MCPYPVKLVSSGKYTIIELLLEWKREIWIVVEILIIYFLNIRNILMLSRLVSKYSFVSHRFSTPEANAGLLKKFGITSPSVYRNLTYSVYDLEFPSIMSWAWVTLSEEPTKFPIPSLRTEHLLLSQANAQGNFHILWRRVPKAKSFVNDDVRERELGWGEINKRLPATSFPLLEKQAV